MLIRNLMATACYKFNETRNIAVVGCGIGGAALALALQQKGLPVKVYEGDTSFDVRKQGYLRFLCPAADMP
jgi:2-polyprenyl-6-methoxyphenol hydroxylase-like FAD-dependent oxidoreductase